MYEYTSDPEVAKYVAWNKQDSIEEATDYIKSVLREYEEGDNPYIWAIELKENHKMIGTIEVSNYSKRHKWFELDSDLNRNYWNKGINTETLKAVIHFFFTSVDINKIQARCYAKNIGSSKVLEKAGMTYEGIQRQHLLINGEYHDLLRYSILKDDYLSQLNSHTN